MEKLKVFFVATAWRNFELLGRRVEDYQKQALSGLECRFCENFAEAEKGAEEGVFNVFLPLACPLISEKDLLSLAKSMSLRGIKALKFHASSAVIWRGKAENDAIFVNNSAFFEINDAKSFSMVYNLLKDRIADRHLANGVVIFDKSTTFIDDTAEIGREAKILPFCRIEGNSRIASGATVSASYVRNSIVREGAAVEYSHLCDSAVGENATVGPYARLRGANIGKGCRIGDFVEIKASDICDGAKSAHLAYIGDATVGERTNIGCGTVVCNYDGKQKHKTTIGADCFVGANTNLVAPVVLGDKCFVGAGTTIARDVAPNTFALGRAETKLKPRKTT